MVAKRFFKSKTIWLGIIVAGLSALQGFVLAVPIEPITQALIGFVLSVIIIILRYYTHGSIKD